MSSIQLRYNNQTDFIYNSSNMKNKINFRNISQISINDENIYENHILNTIYFSHIVRIILLKYCCLIFFNLINSINGKYQNILILIVVLLLIGANSSRLKPNILRKFII